jgi:hypothetical protein
MSKHRRKSKGNSRSIPQPNPRAGRAWIILLVVGITALLVFGFWKSGQTSPGQTEPEPARAAATNVPPSAAAQVSPDFQKLRGRWLRPDGGYVIEIRGVDADGQLDATYSNPRPIHVAKAQAIRDGAQTKVFIELRDVNYPGSTYTLTYLPEEDQLHGIYYQALEGQRFEVVFVRIN